MLSIDRVLTSLEKNESAIISQRTEEVLSPPSSFSLLSLLQLFLKKKKNLPHLFPLLEGPGKSTYKESRYRALQCCLIPILTDGFHQGLPGIFSSQNQACTGKENLLEQVTHHSTGNHLLITEIQRFDSWKIP